MKLINSVSIAGLASLSCFFYTSSSEAANFTNIQYKETAQAFKLTFNWDGNLPTAFGTFRVGINEIKDATGQEPLYWDPEIQITQLNQPEDNIYDLSVFGRHDVGPHTGDVNPGETFRKDLINYFSTLFPQTTQSTLIAEGIVVHKHIPKPNHSDFYRLSYTSQAPLAGLLEIDKNGCTKETLPRPCFKLINKSDVTVNDLHLFVNYESDNGKLTIAGEPVGVGETDNPGVLVRTSPEMFWAEWIWSNEKGNGFAVTPGESYEISFTNSFKLPPNPIDLERSYWTKDGEINFSFTFTGQHIPEPTTVLGLLVFGGVGLLSSKKKMK